MEILLGGVEKAAKSEKALPFEDKAEQKAAPVDKQLELFEATPKTPKKAKRGKKRHGR